MLVINRTTVAALALVATAALGLTACSATTAAPATPKPSSSPQAMTADPAAGLVGPGCAAYASANPNGGGSIVGMSQDLVAQAASNNPLLTTLVAAVSGKLNPKGVNLLILSARHIARLRELTNDFTPPEHACTTWRAYLDAMDRLEQDLHRHIHKENHVLFPKVMELLYAVRSAD